MEKGTNLAIGQNIRSVRKAAGETQQQLGEAVGVVQQSVAAWESDRCMPDLQSLANIAKHYNVTTDALLGLGGPLPSLERGNLNELRDCMELARQLPEDLRNGIVALIRLDRAGLQIAS
jgi:transcriptional regulator with XRE-family HTH domain